ncbi:hypothetical protein ID866_7191 [Astraeus odoratus]|nr:hypothetical protein ID866_7191 [Astraeus odoratus]
MVPTTAEIALVDQIFAQADTQKIGILPCDAAVKVFHGSKLSPTILGHIWSIADEENNGFLTRKETAIALRLIGHVQSGEEVQRSLISKPGPLATIEGMQLVRQGIGMPIPESPPPMPGLPPLTAQDKAKFLRWFQMCSPVDGLLSGEKAYDMFMKSKLSVDTLSQIWELCDTQERGALDLTDFTIAMYFIQACMSGKLSILPNTLPLCLYEQASGRLVSQATRDSLHQGSLASGTPSPVAKQSLVEPQLIGQPHNVPLVLPLGRPVPAVQSPSIPPFPPLAAQPAVQWDVTPTEKAASDWFFDALDTNKCGYIEGDVASTFMAQSTLSDDVLAQVWDLADLNDDGCLTRDGFAVAMHLIEGKLTGKEIPATLPPTLVPPSIRTTASPSKELSPPETIHDLLWGNPTSVGESQNVPQLQITTAQAPGHLPASSVLSHVQQDPFGALATVSPFNFNKDLLGDVDDSYVAPPLHDQSAEISNMRKQLMSTNKSLQTAKVERDRVEAILATQAAELSALQTQLAAARASFETESTLLNSLRGRHTTQAAELWKLREEVIRRRSNLIALHDERAELEWSLLRVKEVRSAIRQRKLNAAEEANYAAAVLHTRRQKPSRRHPNAVAGPSRISLNGHAPEYHDARSIFADNPHPLPARKQRTYEFDVLEKAKLTFLEEDRAAEQEMQNENIAFQLQKKFDAENAALRRQRTILSSFVQHTFKCGICLEELPEDDASRVDGCQFLGNRVIGITESEYAIWMEMQLSQFSILLHCRKYVLLL